MLRIGVFVLAVLVLAGLAGHAVAEDAVLEFARDGAVVRRLDRAALEKGCGVATVELEDPYYGRRMAYVACPLAKVLEMGFGEASQQLAAHDYLLRARDGYVKPATGRRLMEPGGGLALADARREKAGEAGWAPIDRKQVDPAPFYVVWSQPGQQDTNVYPWPYQLVRIEVGSIAAAYPEIVPRTAAAGSEAWRGFDTFKGECVACHAINGQGGKVGPELNVPQSIVEYRPAEQIKAYVYDPETFRHTSMPAHRHLTPAQLDELVAYFRAMSTLKRDPGRLP
ncbi:MAG: cytochrome c [Deltaproteobacteria bacterium]|nr:cytochrome c [Deltaproteobacteria bacterium]